MRMKGGLEGKTFYGQTEAINTVRINGVDIQVAPEDVKAEFDGTTATYVMTVKNEKKHIDAEITAELKAEANQLAFNITKIENKLQDQTTHQQVRGQGGDLSAPDRSGSRTTA